MREAIRYLTPEKLEIFIKIPFLVHINAPDYPGFVDAVVPAHGIWNFENSGFFKEAASKKKFPKSIIETIQVKDPAVQGFYHIGSLGTFTQSEGSDFDYWVIIDKKKFSRERYENLEKKLDGILRHAREKYHQEVTFFIMDQKDIRQDRYGPFDEQEALSVPKIFLKEEFYRTFLMIAGKIPLWAVLPEKIIDTSMNLEGIASQCLAMYDDLLDLGGIKSLPDGDILKGLLWHICKSKEDPVKALIKATMIFSHGFARKVSKGLLCEKIKQDYACAGIDDYGTDPYKALFDRILEYHEKEESGTLNLIKNAVFFRLCGYPNVEMPGKDTPKRALLNKYILLWQLNHKQVQKLLDYTEWSESEKLILEQTIINRLAQMYNHAIKSLDDTNKLFSDPVEERNWRILRNKTRQQLKKAPYKISQCSTYVSRLDIAGFDLREFPGLWKLDILTAAGQKMETIYKHPNFAGVLGWVIDNQLYNRKISSITLRTKFELYESTDTPMDTDRLYMAFAPLKPLSEACYAAESEYARMMVILSLGTQKESGMLLKAELLVANTWGEMFFDAIDFETGQGRQERLRRLAVLMEKYRSDGLRLHIYHFSDSYDPDIVYQVKKAYSELTDQGINMNTGKKKIYLDRL